MRKDLIIVGTSTNAKHVYHFVKDYDLFNVTGFAVNREYITNNEFMGLPVYAIEDLDNIIEKKRYCCLLHYYGTD